MQQLLILSGKGGTGKTTIAGAFVRLSKAKAYADCYVEAPNLHLLMNQRGNPRSADYYGLPKAQINQEVCVQCDLCRQNCRFQAIELDKGLTVNPYACEGCGLCVALCPVKAISLANSADGELRLYLDTAVFSTAQLKIGNSTSGVLVTEVKKQLKSAAPQAKLAVIDGSPGIGCPVIASLSGADLVLIVAEPSLSGIHDLLRIIRTAESFQAKIAVCINKYDTSHKRTLEIESLCEKLGLPLVGRIPFDPMAITATNKGMSIADIKCAAGEAVREVFLKTWQILDS